MKKIAILGGSFDPPHWGHIRLLNKLHTPPFTDWWMMPCYSHNYGKKISSNQHRIEMCNILIENSGNTHIMVSTHEVDNKITGGTYESLSLLSKENEYFFIIGQDNADSIYRWVNYQKLISEFKFWVFPRGDKLPDVNSWYLKKPHIFYDENFTSSQTSSTMIRELVKCGNLQENLTHPEVIKYIKQHDLYKD